MDRNELLATMYHDDEADGTARVPIEQGHQRSRKIRVGIIEYEVPTMDALRHLEHTIAQQAQMLAQQRRLIARIESGTHTTRNLMRQYVMRHETPKYSE